jgi:hypothetical protein
MIGGSSIHDLDLGVVALLRSIELHKDFLLVEFHRRNYFTSGPCCHDITVGHYRQPLEQSHFGHHEHDLLILDNMGLLLCFGPTFPGPMAQFTTTSALICFLRPVTATLTPATTSSTTAAITAAIVTAIAAALTRCAQIMLLRLLLNTTCVSLLLDEVELGVLLHCF